MFNDTEFLRGEFITLSISGRNSEHHIWNSGAKEHMLCHVNPILYQIKFLTKTLEIEALQTIEIEFKPEIKI